MASTRPKIPSPPRLAQKVGALGLESGSAGRDKEATAAAVVMVSVSG